MKRWLGRTFMGLTGWELEGERPVERRYVMIAAPHTTNWDFIHVIAMAFAHGVKLRWVGKATLFRWPFGWFFRMLGGRPVLRDRSTNTVAESVARFAEEDDLILMVPAEGARARQDYWRSGFYHIAREAGVPIVLGYMDYARKRGGWGPVLYPGDDLVADMDRIRAFYHDKIGLYPDQFTPPRLRDEDA